MNNEEGKVTQGLSLMLSSDNIKRRFSEMLGTKAAGFMSSILSAVNSNPALKEADPMTVVSAAAIAASLDLPINSNLGFAHIVPYKGRAQFQMGWKGFIQLALRTGQYENIHCAVVYEGEIANVDRFTGEIIFSEAGKISDTVVGYVAYFKLLNKFRKWYYMTAEEMAAHGKKYSQSYASDKGQWKQNPHAMGLKTVVKMLLSKYGILSIGMETALQADQAVIREDGTYDYADRDTESKGTAAMKRLEGDNPEPATPNPYVSVMEAERERVGDAAFFRELGNQGYTFIDEIPKADRTKIHEAVKALQETK